MTASEQVQVVTRKTQSKQKLPPQQVSFSRNMKKVDQLRKQLEELRKEYEHALQFYHSKVVIAAEQAGEAITKFLIQLQIVAQNPRKFTTAERKTLVQMKKSFLKQLLDLVPVNKLDPSIYTIYEEVHGLTLREEARGALAKLEERLRKDGLADVDLSDIEDPTDIEAVMRKIFEKHRSKTQEGSEAFQEHVFEKKGSINKPESKRETAAAQRKAEIEELKSKGLQGIYKRLVKELHPDREMDPEKKLEKESLMKQITVAYEKNDLSALLLLEASWFQVEGGAEAVGDDKLKAYNALLKDQIKELKYEFCRMPFHPRYAVMGRFINDDPMHPMRTLINEQKALLKDIKVYSLRLKDLSGPAALRELKNGLKSIQIENEAQMRAKAVMCALFGIDSSDLDEEDRKFWPFSES